MGADQYSISGAVYSFERYSVFEALQYEPHRPVLVHKLGLYYSDNKKSMDHSLTQVRAWAQWHHPYLLEIFDCWRMDNELAFVTRRPHGPTVFEMIERNQELSPKTVFEMTVQAASALRYLHEMNEPHGRLDLNSFTMELDQWLVLTQPGWGVKLNTIVEENNTGIVSSGDEEKQAMQLQDLVDWAVIAGALLTFDFSFGYKMLGGQQIKEVAVDQSRALMNVRNIAEAMQRVILGALKARQPEGDRLTSFEQVLGALRDVRM